MEDETIPGLNQTLESRRRGGIAAMRSTTMQHFDEEMMTELAKEQEAREEEVNQEYDALRKIAALEDHPGWQLMKAELLNRIELYRSGRVIPADVRAMMTDSELGSLTRNMNLVADELTTLLNAVTLSVSEVEKHKQEERNATRRVRDVAERVAGKG